MFTYQAGFPDWKKSGYPVEQMSGFVLNVQIPLIGAAELKGRLDKGEALTLLDIRDDEDRGVGVIGGSLWIPLEDLMARHETIPKSKPVVIVCLRGKQGPIAGQYLAKQGHTKVFVLDKGVKDGWLAAGYPLEAGR